MPGSNTLMKRLGLRHPILQAPMAGGGDTPEMVIASRNDGALGSIGCSYLTAEQIALAPGKVRAVCGNGFDAIVAQGAEAGGHRGTFSGDFDSGTIDFISLVPAVVQAVSVPVVASGGIGCGRGIAAALSLGASAVQLGTAFLTCAEAGIPQVYKDAVLGAESDETRITKAFSGRPARGIVNRVIEASPGDDEILPFPYQNALTRPMRAAAAKQGRAEFLSLWAGQGVDVALAFDTAALIERLVAETRTAMREAQSLYSGQSSAAHSFKEQVILVPQTQQPEFQLRR